MVPGNGEVSRDGSREKKRLPSLVVEEVRHSWRVRKAGVHVKKVIRRIHRWIALDVCRRIHVAKRSSVDVSENWVPFSEVKIFITDPFAGIEEQKSAVARDERFFCRENRIVADDVQNLWIRKSTRVSENRGRFNCKAA